MLVPRVAANNLRAECDVNNEAKILRIEIVFATLKPALYPYFKIEIVNEGQMETQR